MKWLLPVPKLPWRYAPVLRRVAMGLVAFLFLIALILKLNWDNNSHREYGHERDNEKQREQDISLFLSTTVPATSAGCISTLAL